MRDEYLIRCAQSGDKQALDKLVRRYYDKIYAFCYHHIGNPQTAEDICQDTFCSVLAHIEEYRHYDKFQNYLYVVAGNKCKDFYKKKKLIYVEAVIEDEETAKESFEDDFTLRELVQGLPKELQEVIILRFYQQLRYQDIAKIVHISTSLVKYRVKKATALLKEELERSSL